MKRICKYMIMGAVALSMTACNDSFLDRTPTNDLNDNAFSKYYENNPLKTYAAFRLECESFPGNLLSQGQGKHAGRGILHQGRIHHSGKLQDPFPGICLQQRRLENPEQGFHHRDGSGQLGQREDQGQRISGGAPRPAFSIRSETDGENG